MEHMQTAVRMYYEHGKTKNEIACAVVVFRPRFIVLLMKACECGMVSVAVNGIHVTAKLLPV